MLDGNTIQGPNAAKVLERSYSEGDAVPPGPKPTAPLDQLESSSGRPLVRRTQSAPQPAYSVPQPAPLSAVPAHKRSERVTLVPESQPSIEIQMLRPIDERDPEIILLSPLHQRRDSGFHLAMRIHDYPAYCEGGDTLTELIGVKEVFEGSATNDRSAVFEEATIARAAQSEVGVDEVRSVEVAVAGAGVLRWSYGTMRLGGEMHVRDVMRYVPEAIRRTPVLAREHRIGHSLVVLQLARQIAAQLAVAHNKVAHLDIKPDNVFVSPEGVARVGDWGTGQPLGGTPRDDGTHGFMPLEQYGHDSQIKNTVYTPVRANTKSDMWSFGVLLMTALIGRNPFWEAYKLPCIRKLELYKAWEFNDFTQDVKPLFTQDREADKRLFKNIFVDMYELRRDFPDFAPLINSVLRSNVDDRIDAASALEKIDVLWQKFGGDEINWPSFWATLSTVYRRHDPNAQAIANSVAELNGALHIVRTMYWDEVGGSAIEDAD